MGFAEAVPVPGRSFHGVLHCVDDEMIDTLDKIEAGYNRVEGIARTHMMDPKYVGAIVYSANKELEDLSKQPTNLPTERYISIMVEGAKHFGAKQCHIDYLENCDFVPPALPHEFKPFEERNDDLPLMTYDDDVKPSYDGTKSPVIRTTTNGKVKARISLSIDDFMHQMTISLIKLHGHAEELFLSKVLYDTIYGAPHKLEDFTKVLVAYLEDLSHSIDIKLGTIEIVSKLLAASTNINKIELQGICI